MDNWDKFKQNLNTAEGSDGTLQNQADIYAESWEASKKRVQASLQEIYSTLIDEDFFKGVNNAVSGVLGVIKNLLDGIGGAQGAFLLLGNIMLKAFSGQLSNTINNVAVKISEIGTNIKKDGILKTVTGEAQKNRVLEQRQDIIDEKKKNASGAFNSKEYKLSQDAIDREVGLQQKLLDKSNKISEKDREILNNRLDIIKAQNEELVNEGKKLDLLEKEEKSLAGKAVSSKARDDKQYLEERNTAKVNGMLASVGLGKNVKKVNEDTFNKRANEIRDKIDQSKDDSTTESLNKELELLYQVKAEWEKRKAYLDNKGDNAQSSNWKEYTKAEKGFQEVSNSADAAKNAIEQYKKEVALAEGDQKKLDQALENLKNNCQGLNLPDEELDKFGTEAKEAGRKVNEMLGKITADNFKGDLDIISNDLKELFDDNGNLLSKAEEAGEEAGEKYLSGFLEGSEGKQNAEARMKNFKDKTATEINIKNKDRGIKAESDDVNQEIDKKSNLQKVGDITTKTAQGVTQLASAITSLKSLGSIWSNEDTSTGEKLLSTVTSLGMAIPMLVSSMQSMKAGLVALGIAEEKDIALVAIRKALGNPWVLGIMGIVALTVALVALANRESEEEKAAKKAAKTQEELSKKAKEAKDELESIKSAVDGYDELVDKLNSCTKGTEEWNEALKEVNQSARELMNEYPDLAKYYTGLDSNGMMSFDNNAVDKYLEQQENAVNTLEAASLMANVRVQEANNTLDLHKETQKITGVNQADENLSFIADIGNALSESKLKENLNDLGNISKTTEEFEEELKESGVQVDHWKNLVEEGYMSQEAYNEKINTLQSDFQDLSASAREASESLRSTSQYIIDSQYGDKSEEERAILTNAYSSQIEGIQETYSAALGKLQRWDGANKELNINGDNISVEELWNRYQEETGAGELARNAIAKKDGEVQFQYYDGSNIETVTMDYVASVLATKEALENLGTTAELASQILNNIDNSEAPNEDKGLARSYITNGNLEGATKSQYDKIVDKVSDENGNINDTKIVNYLKEIYGISEEELKQIFGTEDVAGYFKESLNIDFDSIFNGFSKKVQTAAKGINFDGTYEQLQKMGQKLQEAYEISGAEGLGTLQNFMSGLSNEDLSSFLELSDGLDYSSMTAQQLRDKLDEAGISTNNLSNQELQNLINALDATADSVESLTSKFKTQNDIISKLSDGDVISADDYNKLDEEYKKYFDMQMDGQYKLTESAEALQKAFNSNSEIDYANRIIELGKQNTDLQNMPDTSVQSFLGTAYDDRGDGSKDNPYRREIDSDKAQQQLDILKAIGEQYGVNKGQLDEWQTALESGNISIAQLDKMSEALNSVGNTEEIVAELTKANAKEMGLLGEAILLNSSNLADLNSAMSMLNEAGYQAGIQQYGEALMNIASQYENTSEELESYKDAMEQGLIAQQAYVEAQQALDKGTAGATSRYLTDDNLVKTRDEAAATLEKANAIYKEAEAKLYLSTLAGETAANEDWDISADAIEAWADEIQQMEEYTGASIQQIGQLAIAYTRCNTGLNDLVGNSKNYKEIISNIQESGFANTITADAAKTNQLIKSFSNLLNTSKDVASELLKDTKNAQLLERALDNDRDAIKELDKQARKLSGVKLGITSTGLDVAEESLNNIYDTIENLNEGDNIINLDIEGGEEIQSTMQSIIESLWNSSSSIDEFQNKMSQLDLFGDLAENTQESMNAIVGHIHATAANMEAAGYVLIENASGITEGLMNNLQLETDVGTESTTINDTSTEETPGGWTPEVSYDTAAYFPNVQQSGDSKTGGLTSTAVDGTRVSIPKLTYKPNNSEKNTTQSETVAPPKVWVRPRKGGGAGTTTNSNKTINNGGSGGGSKGSGNPSSSAPKRSAVGKQSSNIERYHVVNKQLSTLSSQYDRISNIANKAFGGAKLDNIDALIKKQSKLINTQKKLTNEAKKYLDLDKDSLEKNTTASYEHQNGDGTSSTREVNASASSYLGMSINYDANGNILNYDELMEKAEDLRNQAARNFEQATDQNDATTQNTWAAAQAQYEAFREALAQYEETLEQWRESIQAEQEAIIKKQELKLQKVQYKIQLKIDIDERKLKLLEYYLSKNTNASMTTKATKAAIKNYTKESGIKYEQNNRSASDAFSIIDSTTDINGKSINYKKVFGMSREEFREAIKNGEYSINKAIVRLSKKGYKLTEDQIKELQGIGDRIVENSTYIREQFINSLQAAIDWMDQYEEKFSKNIDRITRAQESIKHNLNTLDLLGSRYTGVTSSQMIELRQRDAYASRRMVQSTKAEYEAWQIQYDTNISNWEQKRDEALRKNETAVAEQYQTMIDNTISHLNDAKSAYEQAIEDALSSFKELFDANVQDILNDFTKNVANEAYSLEALQASLNQTRAANSTYVDDYEKIYQTNKLIRDIEKDINNTDNIKNKKELAELENELIDIQKTGKKLSEYDISYLQKKYELKKAELALEEAQNNKSEVSMVRDSEGNYGYMYTANEEDVAQAEQNYEDKLYEMEKLNAEYITDLEDKLVQIQTDYANDFQALGDLYEKGSDEYNKALDELNKRYAKYFQETGLEMEKVLGNNQYIQENYIDNYNNKFVGGIEAGNVKLKTSFEQLDISKLTGFSTIGEIVDTFLTNQDIITENAKRNNETYAQNVIDTVSKASISVESITKDIVDLDKETSSARSALIADTKKLATQWAEVSAAIADAEEAFSNFTKNESAITNIARSIYNSINNLANNNYNKTNEGIATAIAYEKKKIDSKYSSGYLKKDGTIDWDKVSEAGGSKLAISTMLDNNSFMASISKDNSETAEKYVYKKRSDFSSYDTGGYTGDWGTNEGKFAMLHQKEIVLNADDTENFLSAINIIRDISNAIDLNALSAGGAFAQLLSSNITQNQMGKLEQQVTITAEFPNATDKHEILSAFENVVNLASQYANRS